MGGRRLHFGLHQDIIKNFPQHIHPNLQNCVLSFLSRFLFLAHDKFHSIMFYRHLALIDHVPRNELWGDPNRPYSYARKESESNDVMMQFEEFSNAHNSDRASNATLSSLAYKIAYK